MPILKTQAFTTKDGKTFPTIEEAQAHELSEICGTIPHNATGPQIAKAIVDQRDAVLEILTSTGRKPRKRKGKNGATRRPKATPMATEAPTA